MQERRGFVAWGRWYGFSLLAFVLAMLSKGSVAILPLVLLWIVWWQRPLVKEDLLRTAPFWAIAVVLTGVNIWCQGQLSEEPFRNANFTERLSGAGAVVWFYLSKALVPINLMFVYPQWHIKTGDFLWWLPLSAALLVSAALVWRRHSPQASWGRPLLFAWGFFCLALVPVLGFTDVGFMRYSLVADHYQHIAMIGVMALAAAVWSNWHQQAREASRSALVVIAAFIVSAFTLLSWQQSRLYADAITLYQATLEKNPTAWLIHYNLGVALSQAGWSQEVIEHYQRALRIKPDYAAAHSNLGAALAQAGRVQEAIDHCQQALRLKPDYPEASNNLGAALLDAGRTQEAIEQLEQSLRLRPNYALAHNNLGNALLNTGRTQEAIEQYWQALQLKSNFPEAQNNLGFALANAGRLPEAIEQYRQALRLKPEYAEAHLNLGNVLLMVGRTQEAAEHFEQALQFKPDYAEAHYNLGNMLVGAGRVKEAIEHYQQALRIKPDYAKTHSNLGVALAQAGQLQEAIEHFRQSLRLNQNSSAEVHYNLGMALAKTGQLQEGIDYFQQAIRLKPDYTDAYANLATAYAQMHQYGEAIAAAQTALDLARSQGQTTMAQQIESALTSYRTSQSNSSQGAPRGEVTPATP